MIEIAKMKGILELFGPTLPSRSLFFATRQTQEFITPGYLKSLYHEPALPKAFARFEEDFKVYAATVEKPTEVKKVIPPTPKKPQQVPPVVTKDA